MRKNGEKYWEISMATERDAMNSPEKNGIPLWIGNYSFSVTEEPDSNGLQVWIKRSDGEGMGISMSKFDEIMDNFWLERF